MYSDSWTVRLWTLNRVVRHNHGAILGLVCYVRAVSPKTGDSNGPYRVIQGQWRSRRHGMDKSQSSVTWYFILTGSTTVLRNKAAGIPTILESVHMAGTGSSPINVFSDVSRSFPLNGMTECGKVSQVLIVV